MLFPNDSKHINIWLCLRTCLRCISQWVLVTEPERLPRGDKHAQYTQDRTECIVSAIHQTCHIDSAQNLTKQEAHILFVFVGSLPFQRLLSQMVYGRSVNNSTHGRNLDTYVWRLLHALHHEITTITRNPRPETLHQTVYFPHTVFSLSPIPYPPAQKIHIFFLAPSSSPRVLSDCPSRCLWRDPESACCSRGPHQQAGSILPNHPVSSASQIFSPLPSLKPQILYRKRTSFLSSCAVAYAQSVVFEGHFYQLYFKTAQAPAVTGLTN